MIEVLARMAQMLINVFSSARFTVEGGSMLPALAHRDSVLAVRPRFSWNRLRRGDIVVLRHPERSDGIYVKRVVGLPNEDVRVDSGLVYLGGALLEETYMTGPLPGRGGPGWGVVDRSPTNTLSWETTAATARTAGFLGPSTGGLSWDGSGFDVGRLGLGGWCLGKVAPGLDLKPCRFRVQSNTSKTKKLSQIRMHRSRVLRQTQDERCLLRFVVSLSNHFLR